MQIDKTKPILITGATGYVAGWLVKRLLEEGMTVHAAVRNPENKEKLAHLESIASNSSGQIKYFKSDLLQDGSYAEAMDGCELVFHTASPFTTDVKDPQKELIDPAVKGTENVLEQANKTPSVKRVVLTSSCAAIYTDCSDLELTPNGVFTEEIWNTTASLNHQPYSYSKTLAEREAWRIQAEQTRWDLVAVNPSMVMGPSLNAKTNTSESMNLLKQLGDGTMKSGVPNAGVGVVDVRDLTEAHYQAGFRPTAEGRHIVSGHNSNFLELAQILNMDFGDRYPVPKKALPKWLLMIIGPIVNKVVTRRWVRNNINMNWKADNTKSKKELGVTYRPLQETMYAGFEQLIESGVLKKK
ncbi:NAD-dependent epimerase/dehydratase family protein [Cryomorphaceae bacterium 1068]|nr:NAD-dependent epimerase/dehydratase family protein [Cryomorphaceae bacterium 1068]